MSVARRVVVVGTGTEIGKTHVSCALLAAARTSVRPWLGLKPIETGVGPVAAPESDSERLARSGAFHVKQAAPYRFREPVSPHLAARASRIVIEPARVRDWVEACAGDAPVLVETAGGWFSPLGPGLTNFELARALEPARILLVAPDRLGVLHELTATLGFARSLGRAPDVIVLSAPAVPDASTGTNAAEVEALGLGAVTAVFPRAGEDTPESREAADRVWRALAG